METFYDVTDQDQTFENQMSIVSEIANAKSSEEALELIGDVSTDKLPREVHSQYIKKLIEIAESIPVAFSSTEVNPERKNCIDRLKEYAEKGAYTEEGGDEGTMDYQMQMSQTERAAEAVKKLTTLKIF